jgi:hypothetical protein
MAAHKGQPTGKCTVCAHLERTRIELLVLGGASQRSVGRKYGLSHHSLCRHFANHISEERKANLILGPVQRQALAARVCEESESVLDHFKATRSGLYSLFDSAVTAGDGNTGALVAGRLTEVNNAIGRLTGQLMASPLISNTTNIFLLPAFAKIEALIVNALLKHPEARTAVIKALREHEASELQPVVPAALIEHEAVDAA